jgi:hypothetical protein
MKNADVLMRDALNKYMSSEDPYLAWFSEYTAVMIVRQLSKNGDKDAKLVESVMMTEEDTNRVKRLRTDNTQALYQKLASDQAYDYFRDKLRADFITDNNLTLADEREAALTQKKTNDNTNYVRAKSEYDSKMNEIKRGASTRIDQYVVLRGTAYADANDDPVVLMNRILNDINQSTDSYTAADMNEQVGALYENYNTDIRYLDSVHALIKDLSDNLLPDIEKKANFKEKQLEIQEYYHKQYEQQIFLVKILIVFCLFVAIGNLLMYYSLMTMTVFAAYVGLVSSVAFVVFFYYLWDFYVRDTIIFDEYQFDTYLPPSNGKVLDTTFKDNIIYC